MEEEEEGREEEKEDGEEEEEEASLHRILRAHSWTVSSLTGAAGWTRA